LAWETFLGFVVRAGASNSVNGERKKWLRFIVMPAKAGIQYARGDSAISGPAGCVYWINRLRG
jgi:hypothetical protein